MWLVPLGAQAQPEERPLLSATPRSGPITIDGVLDEPDWQRAPVGSNFVERLPSPGATPPVATEVQVLVDRGALYVAVTSYFDPGTPPRALELTRDSFRIWDDDAVTVKIDVRRDRRSTVGFAVNPANAQIDFVALDNGRAFLREFDAVWESGTTILEDRWIAELRIPAAAMRLPPGEGDRVLGFNVSRDHNARQATYDWSHLPPEFGPVSALHYGEVHDVRGLGGGRPFILNPYVLGFGPGREEWGLPVELRAGGEVRLRLADDVWGELTFLTDFSEVDLDTQVVNLDRFPLFFPERRPFFLTGVDVFQFGAEQEAQLFFTRRIGLDDSALPVPIYGGAKVYGREGLLSFGVLDILTAPTPDRPAANWGVARVRANLGDASYIGALFGSRVHFGDLAGEAVNPEPHWTAGLDGLLRAADGRFEINGFGAYTAREDVDEGLLDGFAGRAEVRWRGANFMPAASALYLSEGFAPELGFVRRPSTFQARLNVPWVGRTLAPGVRRVVLSPSARLETDQRFEEVLRVSGRWFAEIESNDRWELRASGEYVEDVVREEFELVPGLNVASGTYSGVVASAGFSSPASRNPSVALTVTARNAFFGGAAYSSSLSAAVALGPHFRASASAIGSLLDFRERDLIATLAVNSVFTVTPSPWIAIDLVSQVNTVESQFIGLLRLRWRYLPGSDVFIVWREQLGYGGLELESERRVTLKLSYRYDGLL